MRADGTVMKTGGQATIAITKVGTGEYCVQTTPKILTNYSVIVATLMGGGAAPGFINANTGQGSVCNPYGSYGVFTENSSGTAADLDFGMMIP